MKRILILSLILLVLPAPAQAGGRHGAVATIGRPTCERPYFQVGLRNHSHRTVMFTFHHSDGVDGSFVLRPRSRWHFEVVADNGDRLTVQLDPVGDGPIIAKRTARLDCA
jgi:hypothetical protein